LDSLTRTVIIKPVPVVTFNSHKKEYCKNDSAEILSGGLPESGIYSGNGVLYGIFTPRNVNAGTHIIKYTFITPELCSGSAVNSFIVHPIPDKPKITNNNGTLITNTASKYQWYFENSPVEGATTQSWKPSEAGNYKVEVANNFDCKSMSDSFYFDMIGVSDNYHDGIIINISPNPVRDRGTFMLDLENQTVIALSLVNLLGMNIQKIKEDESMNTGRYIFEFDSQQLPEGIYFLNLKAGNKIINKKIVIMK
jgi:hypothetical protein